MELQKALRRKAKLKLGIAAPPGGGKTLGALLIAYGLLSEKYPTMPDEEIWGKIAIIDSENGSGELYVGKRMDDGFTIGQYNTITLQAPYEPDKYSKAIDLCFDGSQEVVIIDSTSHLWAGVGGLLEQQGTIAKKSGNSYTAWREVTPQHTRFIDKMLQTDVHIIATMRSKVDYVQEKNDQGKTVVRKIGLNPVQKDGMEYEFTCFIEIDSDHTSFGSKDRTGIIDQKFFKITPAIGKELMKWLESGVDEQNPVLKEVAENNGDLEALGRNAVELCKTLGGSKNEMLLTVLKSFEPTANPNKIKEVSKMKKLIEKLSEMVKEKETK
jgi:hypothetical protein